MEIDISLEIFRILTSIKAYYSNEITIESLSNIFKASRDIISQYKQSQSYEEMVVDCLNDVIDLIDEQIYLYWYDMNEDEKYFKEPIPHNYNSTIKKEIILYINRLKQTMLNVENCDELIITDTEVEKWIFSHRILRLERLIHGMN